MSPRGTEHVSEAGHLAGVSRGGSVTVDRVWRVNLLKSGAACTVLLPERAVSSGFSPSVSLRPSPPGGPFSRAGIRGTVASSRYYGFLCVFFSGACGCPAPGGGSRQTGLTAAAPSAAAGHRAPLRAAY